VLTLRRESPVVEPPAARSTKHSSLALQALLPQLGRGGERRVLDLGPAVGANVSFFAKRTCTLFIADLHHTLFPASPLLSRRQQRSFDATLLGELPDRGPFDLVLAWDLLNYLTHDEISALGDRLSELSAPGAVLFALIATRKQMPNRPMTFSILGPDQLEYELDNSVTRSAPQYKEPDLSRAMPAFTVESTYLLRNGMQEYLFAHRDATVPG
jgi:hypothetical protein